MWRLGHYVYFAFEHLVYFAFGHHVYVAYVWGQTDFA